jgi:sporulation protein YlmC with PRC-barrel domain
MTPNASGSAAVSPAVPGRRYDAALHLLDRQLIDTDGRLVAKVDDLEITEDGDRRIILTAVLTGPGALAPRMHGRLGEWMLAVWARLHPAEQPRPGRIPMGDVVRIDSAVHLGRRRADLGVDGFERWVREHVVERLPLAPTDDELENQGGSTAAPQPARRAGDDDPPDGRRRMVDLLGLPVLGPDGTKLGFLSDLRLAPTATVDGVFPRLVVDGLVVDGRHVGSMLGYDRRAEQGPWVLRRIVRQLHRDAGYLPWDALDSVDWDAGTVKVLRPDLDPLDVATR